MRAFPLGQANNSGNLTSESESRTVNDITNNNAMAGDVSHNARQTNNPQTEASSVSTNNLEEHTDNIELVIVENSERNSVEKSETMSADVSSNVDQCKDTQSAASNNQSMEECVKTDSTAIADPGTNTDTDNNTAIAGPGTSADTYSDNRTTEQPSQSVESVTQERTDSERTDSGNNDSNKPEVGQSKPDTEIQISSAAAWEVSDDTDKKLEQMTENQQTRLAKLQELEELRTRGRARENPEDANLSARERFNMNFNPNIRPQKQLSIREQIRNSRRARRHHSDLQLSQHSPFLSETSTASSAPAGKEQTTSSAINPSAWDSAFSDDRSERMKRLKELQKIRKEGKDSVAASSFDSDILSPRDRRNSDIRTADRRNSAQSDHLSSLFSASRVQPTFSTGGSLFPLSSNISESLPSLVPSNLSVDNSVSGLFNRERNLFSSGPVLTRSASLSTQEVIARAREVINTSGTAALAASSETDVRSSRGELNLHLDLTSEPLTEELGESDKPSAVDQLREARAEAHPRVHDVPLDLNHEDGATCVKAMREAIDETYRNRYKSRGLPSDVADHFLADCFDPKYTFEERIVLIRKKLWGDNPVVKCERGKPDGASTSESEANKSSESGQT
jgi:hypothetical protein